MLFSSVTILRRTCLVLSAAMALFGFLYAEGNAWAASFRDENHLTYAHRSKILFGLSLVFFFGFVALPSYETVRHHKRV